MTGSSLRAIALAIAVLSACTACVTGNATENPFRAGRTGDEEVRLTVRNNDYRDATIYAYWNGARDRVGMVVGKTEETFTLRWRGEEIQLEVDFVAGGRYRTEVVPVYRGDHLEFHIPVGGGAPRQIGREAEVPNR
jgi:hypothetical protein